MATVFDIAAYIIEKQTHVASVKLQKLVYYSQAWSLVWDDAPLFQEEIQAWAMGPVVYELFTAYQGIFTISGKPKYGESNKLTDSEKETIDVVLSTYGDLSGRQLSFLTHSEKPWLDARGNLPDTERSQVEISHEAMHEYYSTLETARDAVNVEEIDWATLVEKTSNLLEDVEKQG